MQILMYGVCARACNKRRKLHNVHYEKYLIYCTLLLGTHRIRTRVYKRMFLMLFNVLMCPSAKKSKAIRKQKRVKQTPIAYVGNTNYVKRFETLKKYVRTQGLIVYELIFKI